MSAPVFSVVIPLSPGESEWGELLARLPTPSDEWEIVLAAATPPPPQWDPDSGPKWLRAEQSGRAAQMNAAARQSQAQFLWFVHADAQPQSDAAQKLRQSVARHPHALHYFPLRFRDGGMKMRINEFGAQLRCALFRNPWGDQSLCIAREIFYRVGAFPENAPYGEDNLFVLRARRMGIPLRKVPAQVATSARGYGNGFGEWARTTCRYQRLWIRQALAARKDSR